MWSEDYVVNLERSISMAVDQFAIQQYEQITHGGIEYQRLFLPKILKHTIWKGVMPSYSEIEHAFNAIADLSKGGNKSKDAIQKITNKQEMRLYR